MSQLELQIGYSVPSAQTIKYMGSKRKIAPFILSMVAEEKVKSVFDGFSGSTFVSQYLANAGFKIHSNDQAIWSKVLGDCFLNSKKDLNHYIKLIKKLNDVKPFTGWYSRNYGGDPKNTEGKKPWQIKNTRKLDAIREEIEVVSSDDDDKNVLLTSLMLALDKVDNTLGHYAAYLGKWSPRSYNEIYLELPKFVNNRGKHKVTQKDIFSAVSQNKCDVAYFDPPYGSNNELMPPSRVRYNAYYHIWKSICLNDKPKLFGLNGRREDSRDEESSIFEDYKLNESGRYNAVEAINNLIEQTPNEIIIFSYSSGGRATKKQLLEIFRSQSKKMVIKEIEHSHNVMKHMSSTGEFLRDQNNHKEFLIKLIRK